MVFCDYLKGLDLEVEGRLHREGIYVYLWLIHTVVQQKRTQYLKAVILYLKKKKNEHRRQSTDVRVLKMYLKSSSNNFLAV